MHYLQVSSNDQGSNQNSLYPQSPQKLTSPDFVTKNAMRPTQNAASAHLQIKNAPGIYNSPINVPEPGVTNFKLGDDSNWSWLTQVLFHHARLFEIRSIGLSSR